MFRFNIILIISAAYYILSIITKTHSLINIYTILSLENEYILPINHSINAKFNDCTSVHYTCTLHKYTQHKCMSYLLRYMDKELTQKILKCFNTFIQDSF